jgi:ribonuclease HI
VQLVALLCTILCLPDASAILSGLFRFDLISDGGFSCAEPLSLPQSVTPPWYLPVSVFHTFTSFSRSFAHALHDVIFCMLLRSVHDLFVYTDGSATSLGFCGAAASFFNSTCGEWSTFSTPVGIGSSLTAELRALDLALSRLSVIVGGGVVQFRRVFLFSDSQAAIGLSQGYFKPTCHFALVSSICSQIARLRRILSLFILWIPRTARIEGNVRADQAARSAVAEVSGHCGLRAHSSRFRPGISSLCVCGSPETVRHFCSSVCVSPTSALLCWLVFTYVTSTDRNP